MNHPAVINASRSDRPFEEAPDLEYYIEDFSEGAEWYRADLDISLIEQHTKMEVYATLANETPEEARTRWAGIEGWMREFGPEEALRQSPVIVRLAEGRFKLIDGWHRMVLARDVFGIKSLPAIVGVEKEPENIIFSV